MPSCWRSVARFWPLRKRQHVAISLQYRYRSPQPCSQQHSTLHHVDSRQRSWQAARNIRNSPCRPAGMPMPHSQWSCQRTPDSDGQHSYCSGKLQVRLCRLWRHLRVSLPMVEAVSSSHPRQRSSSSQRPGRSSRPCTIATCNYCHLPTAGMFCVVMLLVRYGCPLGAPPPCCSNARGAAGWTACWALPRQPRRPNSPRQRSQASQTGCQCVLPLLQRQPQSQHRLPPQVRLVLMCQLHS
jgi:hypothetical protein